MTSVILVSTAKQLGLVSYPSFRWRIAKQWAPVTVCFMAMLLTGFMR